MSWAGCQNNPIDVNFHLQKSLEIFEKNLADKIGSNKVKGIKMSPPPCQIGLKEYLQFVVQFKRKIQKEKN